MKIEVELWEEDELAAFADFTSRLSQIRRVREIQRQYELTAQGGCLVTVPVGVSPEDYHEKMKAQVERDMAEGLRNSIVSPTEEDVEDDVASENQTAAESVLTGGVS